MGLDVVASFRGRPAAAVVAGAVPSRDQRLVGLMPNGLARFLRRRLQERPSLTDCCHSRRLGLGTDRMRLKANQRCAGRRTMGAE